MLPPDPIDHGPRTPSPPEGFGPAPASSEAAIAWLLQELRTLAQAQLARERTGHTLNATALVNEVYLKLRSTNSDAPFPSSLSTADRARFFGLAARAMRQILVDHARTRARKKRGGDRTRVDADLAHSAAPQPLDPAIDPAEIAAALDRLETHHPDAARVVELRFFAGLSEVVIAELLGVTERTVRRHWTFAKAWLHRDLSSSDLFSE